MKSLRVVVDEYRASGKAVGHFNISDSNQLRAIALASISSGLPAIVGLSEGEREYFPLSHARALITLYNNAGASLYLNADHTYDLEKAKAAIDAGVDSIVVDGAALSMEANIRLVKQVVQYARSQKRDVLVEGELGYIGSSSKEWDTIPEGVSEKNLTTPEAAREFVGATGVDCFAPAVGNIHGMLKHAAEPRLHTERVGSIFSAVGVPLVLHGASGNTIEDIRACIKEGVGIVHINTELRILYRDSMYDTIRSHPSEAAPYKFLAPPVERMQKYVEEKLRAFAGE